jgi:hypothetical protein
MTEEPAEPSQNRGSGTSVEDPFRLDAMHPVAGELFEGQIISKIFGEQDQDWFHHQRLSHPNQIREWQIRLSPGQIRRKFFDESRFTYSVPLPDKAREILENAAARRPVPDATLVSRFPLIEVRARTAADAGRLVLTHINKARSQGWTRGNMAFFVDGWRIDQELFRGREKTVMMFDMRPTRVNVAGTDIITFCACDSLEAIDEVERRIKTGEGRRAGKPARRQPTFGWKPLIVAAWKPLILGAGRFGGIAAAVVGVIALIASHSFVTAVELAAGAFGIVTAWVLYQALRLANVTPAEHCKELCKAHLRLKYSAILRHLYPRQDILNEYVQQIEGTPRDAGRWTSFTSDGVMTADSFKRLEKSFEDWLKRSPY